ncbi:hypothetical protein [Sphingomonas sp.]|uniref:hypothetical protein n=1 Tax=Sphingomonas sp. TaxID=28214 RepID=UPI003F70FB49
MAEIPPRRLSAVHLDDLAIVALTTLPGTDPATPHPELDDDSRSRLRARLKLIGRHDWPSSLREDAQLRRGYTLRQCFRLMIALMLLDAHIPPSIAIPIARSNDVLLLRMIAARLAQRDAAASSHDRLAVLSPGQFWEWLDPAGWVDAEPYRIRSIERSELANLWSEDLGLGTAGQRLVLDVGASAQTTWGWIRVPVGPAACIARATSELRISCSTIAIGSSPTNPR